MIYTATITKDLEIRGIYGYLSMDRGFIAGTVFFTTPNGAHYKIREHLKINANATHNYKITRCDTPLSAFDINLLKKNQKITTEKNSLSYKPGYDI